MSVAENTLRKLLNKIIDEQKYKNAEITLKGLNSGGANYTAALFLITIENQNDSLKLFAKVANVNGKIREAFKMDVLFKNEYFVYTELVKVFDNIQDKHNIIPEHRFVFPKFFGGTAAEYEETIILEDLSARGFGSYNRFKPIDWEYAAVTVETLAKFHALSIAYQKGDPENFAKTAEKVKVKMDDHSQNPEMVETWKRMVGGAIQATREEHKEKLQKFLLNEMARNDFYKFKMPISTTVLCHGDYRVSNLLYRSQNDRIESIVVDYQMLHTGSPASDLLYLVFLGTDEEFRRLHYQKLMDHYYKELTAALDRLDIDVNDVYPRETLDSELKELLAPALLMSAIILPLVLVEAEHQPHMGEVSDFQELAVSPTKLFEERFSGLVSDCVRWGAL